MESFLAALSHPESQLPPVNPYRGYERERLAGCLLEAILRAAGLRVHRYISPHLVAFMKRTCLDGRRLTDALLLALATAV